MRSPHHLAIDNETSSHVAHLSDVEHLDHLGSPQQMLLIGRLEQPFQGLLDIINGVVDDRISPDVDLLLVCQALSLWPRPNVESDDDRIRSRR